MDSINQNEITLTKVTADLMFVDPCIIVKFT